VAVAMGGVVDQFLLGELEPLRLAAAALLDRTARLTAALLEGAPGVVAVELVHGRSLNARGRRASRVCRHWTDRGRSGRGVARRLRYWPSCARAVSPSDGSCLSCSSAAIIASRSHSIFAGQALAGWSSSVFRPLPVMIATIVSSG